MSFHDAFRNSTVTNLTYATYCRHGRIYCRLRRANLLCLVDRPRRRTRQRVAFVTLSTRSSSHHDQRGTVALQLDAGC